MLLGISVQIRRENKKAKVRRVRKDFASNPQRNTDGKDLEKIGPEEEEVSKLSFDYFHFLYITK